MELDGTVLGRFGKAGRALKEFSSIHQMDCRNPDEIYVAEITAWRVQKTHPAPAADALLGGRVGGACDEARLMSAASLSGCRAGRCVWPPACRSSRSRP